MPGLRCVGLANYGPPHFRCEVCEASRCLECNVSPYHTHKTCTEAAESSCTADDSKEQDPLVKVMLEGNFFVLCRKYVAV